jgi:transcriptional regulator of acetoin/glycerol metabolism
VTKEEVIAALESVKWSVSKAAKKLGIQRNKLYRMMEEMGIKGPEE